MPIIDFSTPFWLINYYHIIGVISMIFNSFGLYLLMFQNNKLDKIKYYMLAYQIACFITDVHLTLLMQHVPLYPIFGGFTVELLSQWFEIFTHFSMMFIVFLIVVQLESLILCFEKKHQAIAKTLNIHVIPFWFEYFCYFLCVVCPVIMSAWFHSVHLDKDEQWEVIRTNYPQYFYNFQALPNFDVYINTPWFILLLLCTIAGGITLLSFFFIFIIDIFRIMIQLKSQISASRYKQHQEAIQSLMVQFATSSFCLVPPCCLAIIVLSELDNAQLLTELCICWFAMHSSANIISLLIFFPPYRNYVMKKLKLWVTVDYELQQSETSRRQKMNRIFDKSSNAIQPTITLYRRPERSVLSFAEVS